MTMGCGASHIAICYEVNECWKLHTHPVIMCAYRLYIKVVPHILRLSALFFSSFSFLFPFPFPLYIESLATRIDGTQTRLLRGSCGTLSHCPEIAHNSSMVAGMGIQLLLVDEPRHNVLWILESDIAQRAVNLFRQSEITILFSSIQYHMVLSARNWPTPVC